MDLKMDGGSPNHQDVGRESANTLPPSQASEPKDFDAFLCHSSIDSRAVERIHVELERFRAPKGITPRRVRVFHYRHDQRTGPDLKDQLASFIGRSRKLIVVCSPQMRFNDNIAFEVRTFLATHPMSDVAVALVKGTSGESVPDALRTAGHEPVFADLRKTNTSWWRWMVARLSLRSTFVAIIAQILDLDRDKLIRRDRARLVRQRQMQAGSFLAIALGFALSWSAWISSDAHQVRATIAGVPWLEVAENEATLSEAARWIQTLIFTGHGEQARSAVARVRGRAGLVLRVTEMRALERVDGEPLEVGLARVLGSLGDTAESFIGELTELVDDHATKVPLSWWLKTAPSIRDPAVRVHILDLVAARVGYDQPSAEVRPLIEAALAATREIANPTDRLRDLIKSANVALVLEVPDLSARMIRMIEKEESSLPGTSGELLVQIALAWAKVGNVEKVQEWMARARRVGSDPPEETYKAIVDLGYNLAEGGLVEGLRHPIAQFVDERHPWNHPLAEHEIRIRLAEGACESSDAGCAAALEFLRKGSKASESMTSKILPSDKQLQKLKFRPSAINHAPDSRAFILVRMGHNLIETRQPNAAARVFRIGNFGEALRAADGHGDLCDRGLLDYSYGGAYEAARVGDLVEAEAAVAYSVKAESDLKAEMGPQRFAALSGWGTTDDESVFRATMGQDLYSGEAWRLRGLADGGHFAEFDATGGAHELALRPRIDVAAAEVIGAAGVRDSVRVSHASTILLDVLNRNRARIPPTAVAYVRGTLLPVIKTLAAASYFDVSLNIADEYMRWPGGGCDATLAVTRAARTVDQFRLLASAERLRPLDSACRSHVVSALGSAAISRDESFESKDVTESADKACLALARGHALALSRKYAPARSEVELLPAARKLDVYSAILFDAEARLPHPSRLNADDPSRIALTAPPLCGYQ